MLESSSGNVAVHLAVGATASLLSILLVLGLKLKWFRARMSFDRADPSPEVPYVGVYRSTFTGDFDSPSSSSSYSQAPTQSRATVGAYQSRPISLDAVKGTLPSLRATTPDPAKSVPPGASQASTVAGNAAAPGSAQVMPGSSQAMPSKSNTQVGNLSKTKEMAKAPKVKEEKVKTSKVKEETVKAPKVKEEKVKAPKPPKEPKKKAPKLPKEPKPQVEKPAKEAKAKAAKVKNPKEVMVNGTVPTSTETKDKKKKAKSLAPSPHQSSSSLHLDQSDSEIASSNNNAFPFVQQPVNGAPNRPKSQRLDEDEFYPFNSSYNRDTFGGGGQAGGMKTFGSMMPTKGQVNTSVSPIPQFEARSLRNPNAAGATAYKPPSRIPGFRDSESTYVDMDDSVIRGERQYFLGNQDESET